MLLCENIRAGVAGSNGSVVGQDGRSGQRDIEKGGADLA
jgi:hypothetical protein